MTENASPASPVAADDKGQNAIRRDFFAAFTECCGLKNLPTGFCEKIDLVRRVEDFAQAMVMPALNTKHVTPGQVTGALSDHALLMATWSVAAVAAVGENVKPELRAVAVHNIYTDGTSGQRTTEMMSQGFTRRPGFRSWAAMVRADTAAKLGLP